MFLELGSCVSSLSAHITRLPVQTDHMAARRHWGTVQVPGVHAARMTRPMHSISYLQMWEVLQTTETIKFRQDSFIMDRKKEELCRSRGSPPNRSAPAGETFKSNSWIVYLAVTCQASFSQIHAYSWRTSEKHFWSWFNRSCGKFWWCSLIFVSPTQ